MNARPGLYISTPELPAFKSQLDADPLLCDARKTLIEKAEAALEGDLPPESYALAGAGQHGNYQAVSHRAQSIIEPVSFAYLLTGETRFADRAIRALLHFATYEVWTGREFFTRVPSWNSALETARFVQTYAAGIDWLGEAISDADRNTALDALARLGVEPLMRDWIGPEGRVHALDSMGHNWWMVCVGAGGVGALALLGHDPRAETWVRRVVDAVPEFFAYPGNVLQNKMATFDPDGGFYESLGYTNYTLVHYAYLMAALHKTFPEGLHGERFDRVDPALDRMAEFMCHFTYPCKTAQPGGNRFLSVDFGDQSRNGGFSADVTLYLARATRDGRYRWYFDRFTERISSPYQMLFYDPSVRAQPPDDLPTSRVLPGIGWAALRDRWGDDSTLLSVKCGDTWNHAHHDAGSFVVYAGGDPLLIDSGPCAYGRPEYRTYYSQPHAHNLVLPDGLTPPADDLYRGVKFRGRLHSFLPDADVRYVLADATGPFAGIYRRFLRHFLWLDEAIVLVDDLLAFEPARFAWFFHGETPPTFSGNRLRVQGEHAGLQLDVLFPGNLAPDIRTGHPHHEPDQTLDYLALTRPDLSRDAQFLGVIQTGPHPLAVAPISGPEWIGATFGAHTLYVNLRADGRRMHQNSNNELNGWATDAFLLAVESGGRNRILIVGGSYLRNPKGDVIFDCMAKCDALLQSDALCVQGPARSHVRIRNAARVIANSRRMPAEALRSDPPYQVVQMP